MVYSIIQKSQLEGADRIDAEYYQPEYLEISTLLSSMKLISIKNVSNGVFSGPFGSTLKSESYQSSGIPFIRISDVQDMFINRSNLVYISEEENRRVYNTHLDPGDIVLSKIGTIGRLSVISNDLGEVNISENNIGVRLSNLTKKQRAFVLIFLLSGFGQKQILRKGSGNIQQKLNVSDIESIMLPNFGDKQVEENYELFRSSVLNRESSIDLYHQAENLLLEELELKDFKTPEDLSYIVSYSDTEKVDRVDADYFQPKYEFLIEKLGNKKRLSEFAKRTNRSQKIELEKEYNYVEISDVNIGNGGVVSNKFIGKELPANAKIKIFGGELIVSKVRPTRGAIAIIPDEFSQDFVASSAFSVFEIASPTREYLQVVLRSFIGKLQMERPTTGTSYPTITDQDIENIWVPVLPKETQLKIADLVKKSHEARKKSKELLEEAKRKVEEMIEKGGNNEERN